MCGVALRYGMMKSVALLSDIWRVAFDLAWQSMLAGTTPVGAVVTDAGGSIVTTGRGRVYEPKGVEGQLSFSHLAYAELNALAQLPPTHRYEQYVVHTTLEPCVLCVGAAVMATVGRIEYAGADPYGGAAHLRLDNTHTQRLMPPVTGPAEGLAGRLGALLHFAFYLERDPTGVVVQAYRRAQAALIEPIEESGTVAKLIDLRHQQGDLEAVLHLLRQAA